ncbi:TPA: hypothetical protein ACVO0G_004276 [Vibrio diabolicus]
MIDAKLQMFEFGIGINDAINGVWLHRSSAYKDHYTTPKLHLTHEYMVQIIRTGLAR